MDRGHAAVLGFDVVHFGVRMDFDAQPVGAARVTPHHRVVADDAARRVVQRGLNRGVGVRTDVHGRHHAFDLVRKDQAAVHVEQGVVLGPQTQAVHAGVGMRQREMPDLGEQDVEIHFLRQGFVQAQTLGVERNGLRGAVIGAQNGGVPAAVAAADVAAVDDRDVGHALFAEVVGRGQAVHAGTDDDDVVAILEIVPAPHTPFAEIAKKPTHASALRCERPQGRASDRTRAELAARGQDRVPDEGAELAAATHLERQQGVHVGTQDQRVYARDAGLRAGQMGKRLGPEIQRGQLAQQFPTAWAADLH